ncbi:transcriptional regulator [Ammoniphilus sp. CFH 90114]|uniref:ArsR/SmtB family transcription factor n=1 Tax=Ammoniphilus sp. CFH 90114 TaxID=2493665 RepID=UPI001F0CB6EF|nr:helix-turn-helix domain-containing protein [Ammoniphilus sp. CFH 90114]
MYSIKVKYSPVYELINSFYAYIYYPNLKGITLDDQWLKKIRERLPQDYAETLLDERWEVLHRTVLLVSQCPNAETVEGFLGWLEQLPAGELYERLSPWVQTIPLNLAEVRDQAVWLLQRWHEYYFQFFDQSCLRDLQEEAHTLMSRLEVEKPVDLIDQVTGGIYIEPVQELQEVILVPQYHCAPSTILDFYRAIAVCLYPLRPNSQGKEARQNVLQIAQCLGDERRLTILQYLSREPRTLIQIHQHLKLAKSTVHHHMTSLRRAGLVRAHYINSTNVAYYSLRDSFIAQLDHSLKFLLFRMEDE